MGRLKFAGPGAAIGVLELEIESGSCHLVYVDSFSWAGSAYGILIVLTPTTFYYHLMVERRSSMNEFLTNFSSNHTLLWALLIIGVIGASAIGLHLFWTAVFRSVAALRGKSAKNSGGG